MAKKSSKNEEQTKKTTYRKVTISDSMGSYVARLNISESIQHNRPMSSQLTINSKYPFHIRNGRPFYYSGQCSATFVDNIDEEAEEGEEGEEEEDCIDMGVDDDDDDDEDDEDDDDEDDEDDDDEDDLEESDYVNKEGRVADFNYAFAEWLHNGLIKNLKYSANKTLRVGILGEVEITTEQDSTIDDQYNSKVVFSWEQVAD